VFDLSDTMVKYIIRSLAGFVMLGVVGFLLITGQDVPEYAWLFLAGIYGLQQLFDGVSTVQVIRKNGGKL